VTAFSSWRWTGYVDGNVKHMAMQMKAKRDVIFSCHVEERDSEMIKRDDEI